MPGSRFRSKTAQGLNGLSGFPARFERFERFFGKPLKLLKFIFKKPLKSRSFLAAVLNGFSRTIFEEFLRNLTKKNDQNHQKARKRQCDAKKQLNPPVRGRGLMLRPLRLKMGMLRPLRPKSGMFRSLRLKMGMMRLCATEKILCNFARPKQHVLRLCATQKKYGATDHCDSKWVCCDIAGAK